MNDLIASFRPTEKIKELRSNQVDALNQVFDLLTKGCKTIEIEAPPGSGKSLIADTLMNYYVEQGFRCLVASPQNSQVDQYDSAGFGMRTLKGRDNYPCYAGKKNCGEGYCTLKLCPNGVNARKCKEREYNECRRCICNTCYYKGVFRVYKDSEKANTNLMLLMMGITNKPDVLIVDEADTLEPNIRSFESFVIPELFEHFRFPEIIPDLHTYVERTARELESMRKPKNTETELKKMSYLETTCLKILDMIADYQKYKEPWCITTKEVSKKTKFEPVTINRFLKNLLEDRIVFMMSATPPHYPGFEKVRVESIFPIASRQWIYDPFPGSLVKKQREASIPRAAVWISLLKGKSLIHCKSYETAKKLHQVLISIKRSSLLQVSKNDDTDGVRYSRYDAVNAFLKSKNPDEILISVNQGRGLDLWQPEVINNVILVVPWMNPTDPLVKAKCAILGESWKNQEVANEITQAIARHFRNEKMGIYQGVETPKRAYIIDASFGNWYLRNKDLFPKNFIESQRL